ncbi:MAG: SCO family protein [Acidimicrobiia bacterium]|nr:SCO family protein [Acidimicrobiia bacterium]
MWGLRTMAALAAILVLVAGCGSGSSAKKAAPSTLQGYVPRPTLEVGALSLPDSSANDADFPFRAQPGKLLLAYFGYTNCPDICPATLADLRISLKRLGAEAGRVQVAMVTVDPARDTAEILDTYLGHFFKDPHALRTDDPAALQAVADAFGVQYEVQTDAQGTVDVGHTSLVFAIDTKGRVVDAWPTGMDNKIVTDDLRLLLSRQT